MLIALDLILTSLTTIKLLHIPILTFHFAHPSVTSISLTQLSSYQVFVIPVISPRIFVLTQLSKHRPATMSAPVYSPHLLLSFPFELLPTVSSLVLLITSSCQPFLLVLLHALP